MLFVWSRFFSLYYSRVIFVFGSTKYCYKEWTQEAPYFTTFICTSITQTSTLNFTLEICFVPAVQYRVVKKKTFFLEFGPSPPAGCWVGGASPTCRVLARSVHGERGACGLEF